MRVKIYLGGKWYPVYLVHEYKRCMIDGVPFRIDDDGNAVVMNRAGQKNLYRLYSMDAQEYNGGNVYNV